MQGNQIDDPRLVRGLAHPLRVEILRSLEDRVASPREVADEIGAPLANVSYHVRFLARVGLVELVETRQRRGALQHFYRAAAPVGLTGWGWSQATGGIGSSLVRAALHRLGAAISAAGQAGGLERSDALIGWHELALDERGLSDLSAELRRLRARAREIERESEERMASDGGVAIASGVGLLLFETAGDMAPVEARTVTSSERSAA